MSPISNHRAASMLLVAAAAALALAPLAPARLAAQAHESDGKAFHGFSIFVMAGAQRIRTGALNGDLAARGQPGFEHTFASLGAGVQASLGRVLLGLEGAGLVERRAESVQFDRTLSGGYGMADVGYAVLDSRHVRLYPMAGIGVGGVTFASRRQGVPTFGDLLDSPDWAARLSSVELVLQAAVGGDYVVWTGERDGKSRHLSVGVRAGYTFAPAAGAWRLGGTRVVGGPAVRIEGAYARLVVSFGGQRR